MTISTDDINIDKFIGWLESKPSETIVGISDSASECPVANYLKSKWESSVFVGSQITVIYESSHCRTFDTPRDFLEVIFLVDDREINAPVTAKEALAICNHVNA